MSRSLGALFRARLADIDIENDQRVEFMPVFMAVQHMIFKRANLWWIHADCSYEIVDRMIDEFV